MVSLRRSHKFWIAVVLVAALGGGVRYGSARLANWSWGRWQSSLDDLWRKERLAADCLMEAYQRPREEVLAVVRAKLPDWKLSVENDQLESLRDPKERLAIAVYYRNGLLHHYRQTRLMSLRPPGSLSFLYHGTILLDKAVYFFFLPFGLVVLLAAMAWRSVRSAGGRMSAVIGIIGIAYWAAIFLTSGPLRSPIWLAPPAGMALLGLALYRWGAPRPLDPRYCPHCGYDLTGNESGICPECGNPTPATERRKVDEKLTDVEQRLQAVEDEEPAQPELEGEVGAPGEP